MRGTCGWRLLYVRGPCSNGRLVDDCPRGQSWTGGVYLLSQVAELIEAYSEPLKAHLGATAILVAVSRFCSANGHPDAAQSLWRELTEREP